MMAGKEQQLELQLVDDGNKLLNPPFSLDELLSILDRVEVMLLRVKQSSYRSVAAALSPLRKALIMRITAPSSPYNDELMKEIFHQIVAVFQKLSHMSSRCYPKVVSLLVTIATTQAVVVLLDIECHALVIETFQIFLKVITPTRSSELDVIFTAVVAIMSVVVLESDEVPMDFLFPLLVCVRKDNKNVSPTSWMLGKEVMKNCAAKIEPYLLKAVCCSGTSVDNYDLVVGSICQNATHYFKSVHAHGSEEHMVSFFGPFIFPYRYSE
ncbi:unnamed protein product [Dovyalis caffra]|uniref:Uncharacterized protein n=1 Tax=Dovyalis caffra TaxID=77055 RepID=A0AAV1RIS3_9ROSI|nr:unnamed protein product [Dovyalis caffra]